MGSTTAYQCDGPGCDELTTRAAGKRYPHGWLRATIGYPDGEIDTQSGSFHDVSCLHDFVDEHTQRVYLATAED